MAQPPTPPVTASSKGGCSTWEAAGPALQVKGGETTGKRENGKKTEDLGGPQEVNFCTGLFPHEADNDGIVHANPILS